MSTVHCIHCREPVHTDGSERVLSLFGMTTWVHDEPYDISRPWECRPTNASPDLATAEYTEPTGIRPGLIMTPAQQTENEIERFK